MILPSDALVIPQPGFRSDFVGWSDLIGPGIGFTDLGVPKFVGLLIFLLFQISFEISGYS